MAEDRQFRSYDEFFDFYLASVVCAPLLPDWLRLCMDRPLSGREEQARHIRTSVLVVHQRLPDAGADVHREAVRAVEDARS